MTKHPSRGNVTKGTIPDFTQYCFYVQGESEKTEFFDFQKQPEGIQKK